MNVPNDTLGGGHSLGEGFSQGARGPVRNGVRPRAPGGCEQRRPEKMRRKLPHLPPGKCDESYRNIAIMRRKRPLLHAYSGTRWNTREYSRNKSRKIGYNRPENAYFRPVSIIYRSVYYFWGLPPPGKAAEKAAKPKTLAHLFGFIASFGAFLGFFRRRASI